MGQYVALRNDVFNLYICYDEIGHIRPTVSHLNLIFDAKKKRLINSFYRLETRKPKRIMYI